LSSAAVIKALSSLPPERAWSARYGQLELIVPSAADLLAPKLRRGEPRDLAHAAWARSQGLI